MHLCGVHGWTAACCAGEYISESVWASRKDFEAWRDSQKFQQAHGGGEGKVNPAPLHSLTPHVHPGTHLHYSHTAGPYM